MSRGPVVIATPNKQLPIDEHARDADGALGFRVHSPLEQATLSAGEFERLFRPHGSPPRGVARSDGLPRAGAGGAKARAVRAAGCQDGPALVDHADYRAQPTQSASPPSARGRRRRAPGGSGGIAREPLPAALMSNVGLRAPNGILVLVVAVIAAATYTAVVLIVTSGASFYHDEWWYICGRALGDPASWFKPHNEHFVLLHVIAYRALVEGFGLGSYLPFQLATIAPHLMVVLAVAALVDRHASRGAAVGAGLVMLFLGAGYLNLFWGFQVGFVGSTALGLWALWFLPARPLAASVVLALSVATQGVGLFFVVAAGGYLFASGRFRSALWLALPLAVYGIWALTMREAVDVRGELDVAAIPAFVLLGLLATVAATAGLPLLPSVGVALSVIASRPRAWRSPIVVGCALGLLAEYVALATVRQGFDLRPLLTTSTLGQPSSSRSPPRCWGLRGIAGSACSCSSSCLLPVSLERCGKA